MDDVPGTKNVDKIDTVYVCVCVWRVVFSFYYITTKTKKWLSHSRLGRYSAVQFIGVCNGGTNGVNENLLSLFFLFCFINIFFVENGNGYCRCFQKKKENSFHFIVLS